MADNTVADLAREFLMDANEALEILVGLGVEVEEPTSQVPESDAEVFRELLNEERQQNRDIQRRTRRRRGVELLDEDQVRADMRTDEEQEQIRRAADTSAIEVEDNITLRDLATLMKVDLNQMIVSLLAQGKPATINLRFTADEAIALGETYGLRLRRKLVVEPPVVVGGREKRTGTVTIPPVVTIMGHVDHGKTTLLDTIREANVVEGEAGGITQHIGAYQVQHDGETITFIDTPGHEAFTAMRARGAQVTDIVILVVAADDGVMPQTVEAINHAMAAQVPIIVAVNKMDQPTANPDRVLQQLLEHNVVTEDFGGSTLSVRLSAKTGEGVPALLEAITLQAELLELVGNPRLVPVGTVIEANLDRGRGPVATILVRDGTLKKGDALVIGEVSGRVRTLLDHRGKEVKEAGPSMPVEVIGLGEVPQVGESIQVAKNERAARQLAQENADAAREPAAATAMSLADIFAQVQAGQVETLNVVVKADVQGSVEAIVHKLEGLKNADVRVNVTHSGVGQVGKADVDLAKSTNAIILGFNVAAEPAVRRQAEDEGVEINLYAIIYQLLDDVRRSLEGMLEPEYHETVLGHAEVLVPFQITGVGHVAGSKVLDGVMRRGESVRLYRDNQLIFTGRLDSLKRVKETVNEVVEGLECGIHLSGYRGYLPGDMIECFHVETVARTLVI
ncbi:MAG TPA: translation initiation factor IF-2 [Armatimonadetes bacterium]|nr:translation initiation factor IF-2 [Armatimonadota bacterium]